MKKESRFGWDRRRDARAPGAARAAVLVLALASALGACARAPAADPAGMDWDRLLKEAEGTEVRFHMWGGDARINAWIDGFVARELSARYGVKVVRVPMDAAVFVNKLLDEKAAGTVKGTMDLLWINGENFKRAKTEGLLYGPYFDRLPNAKLVDPATAAYDFGFPTEGYEAPYGRAQFVLEYDSAKVSVPPKTVEELAAWIEANPGRFAYPRPPDFTGSAFVRSLLYGLSGGSGGFQGPFDAVKLEAALPALRAWLTRTGPSLWGGGRDYPADKARLDGLFERGEVLFNMSYTQSGAQGLILQGRYPDTVRTAVLAGASPANVHFTAIPRNAPNKAGALVLSDFLLSPEAQASKNGPSNWGDFTVLDMGRLAPEDRKRFESLDLGAATLPFAALDAAAQGEIDPAYVEALEDAWEEIVLGKK